MISLIEVLQPVSLCETCLLIGTHARQRIKICRQPTLVLSQQPDDELSRRMRTHPNQIFPGVGRGVASGQYNGALANAYPAPIKVENGGIKEQPLESGRLEQNSPGHRIEARQRR